MTSNAFRQVNLSENRGGIATAIARINDNASPGQYNLAVRCNNAAGNKGSSNNYNGNDDRGNGNDRGRERQRPR